MAIVIDPPSRNSRTRGTALTSYFDLDVSTTNDAHPTRWAFDGVTFEPYGCEVTVTEASADPCDVAAEVTPAEDEFPDAVTFPPFRFKAAIKAPARCRDQAELDKYIEVQLQAELSPIFGEQVMAGVWNAAAPTLVSEAATVGTALTDTPLEAVAAVEDGLADAWRDSVGMIHVTPGVLLMIADSLEFVEGRFFTPSGHIVVADAGYQGGAPDTGTVTAGQAWIYGSSPVHFRYITPGWHGFDFENWTRDHNDLTVRVDGIGIAVFEPCSVVAAQAFLGAVGGDITP